MRGSSCQPRGLVPAWILCVLVTGDSSRQDSFAPGALWNDTSGQRIRAHSAGLLVHNGSTYWFGADGYNSGDGANQIINVYEAAGDLYNWDNKGVAFNLSASAPELEAGYADR